MPEQVIVSYNIMKNARLHLWEDVSESYCLLRHAATCGKQAVVLFDNAATKAERSYAGRYIKSLDGMDAQFFGVYFDQDRHIVPAVNLSGILEALAGGDSVLLKYQAIHPQVLARGQFKRSEILDKQAVPLFLPNYRERCEMAYVHYSSDPKLLEFIEGIMGDGQSRVVLNELMRVAAENDIWKIAESESSRKYFECYEHKDDEVWVNCGSCRGDTIINFIAGGYGFSKIFAVEGDPRMFAELKKTIGWLAADQRQKIRQLDYFIGDEDSKRKFDNLFRHVPVSLINMDIEGFEMPVLRGAAQIIKSCRPVLAISAYHLTGDLYDIPAFVSEVADDYEFFLRKYSGQAGNDFNEFIYYCVPKERAVRKD